MLPWVLGQLMYGVRDGQKGACSVMSGEDDDDKDNDDNLMIK